MARLLVIDDEPEIGKLFSRILKKKHEVTYEREAHAALERLKAGDRFDVIFCDLMMPRMSGTAFIAQVATLWPEELKRIVVITGGGLGEESRRFLEETTRTILYKPFLLSELESVITKTIGARCA
jgi:CheY-like chemotaxis protein